jgi:hypothetical protein
MVRVHYSVRVRAAVLRRHDSLALPLQLDLLVHHLVVWNCWTALSQSAALVGPLVSTLRRRFSRYPRSCYVAQTVAYTFESGIAEGVVCRWQTVSYP